MTYNQHINSFENLDEYNTYIESDMAFSPNIGFIDDTREVKWKGVVANDYILSGKTKSTSDFTIGSSVLSGDADCITVHVTKSTDGGDNTMYAMKEDVKKSPLQFSQIDNGITSIDKWNIDTSKVTDMSYMFYRCDRLTSLDLSNFNTSNVTSMVSMFSWCYGLTSLNISNFNTYKVTNMRYMFQNCRSLTLLDVSNFNTSNVTNMGSMFVICSGLTSLDVSNFNTSKVTNMATMFYRCSGLTSLDISNFDTSNVTDMSNMFNGCKGLGSLDLSSFDTSNVIDMNGMFQNCSGLASLKLSSSFFNSKSVKTYDFSALTVWTDATSLTQFVEAISAKDGTGKTVKLSDNTKNTLSNEQKSKITSANWTIA